jgi:hypothetical protein
MDIGSVGIEKFFRKDTYGPQSAAAEAVEGPEVPDAPVQPLPVVRAGAGVLPEIQDLPDLRPESGP